MIADARVIGVLVLAATETKRTFTSEELSLLQGIAAEAALSIERVRSAAALTAALGREQAVAAIARRVRDELNADELVRVAREELERALHAERVDVILENEDVRVDVVRVAPLTRRRAVPARHGRARGCLRPADSATARREPQAARAAGCAPAGRAGRDERARSRHRAAAARRRGDDAARRGRCRLLPARCASWCAALRGGARVRPGARRVRVHAGGWTCRDGPRSRQDLRRRTSTRRSRDRCRTRPTRASPARSSRR